MTRALSRRLRKSRVSSKRRSRRRSLRMKGGAQLTTEHMEFIKTLQSVQGQPPEEVLVRFMARVLGQPPENFLNEKAMSFGITPEEIEKSIGETGGDVVQGLLNIILNYRSNILLKKPKIIK